ncbi:mevalonate kinase [Lentilactobacillus hilgardii]|uniref:Mevalonate kinase n=1 Tax=Lentilactobacillus hilgardii (strain ATCC 8290 / DSM 20176 / CCUG 30140 / JCM 1155 / KCTC 3500 / NBRC 15886 / NCIMB 8040 / NRRL B-1843 / 9) TaxID=1423757 RepID=C0XLR1_LENH9|nr:mevalonate kinase [Lentilactobacillus hilgardii]EEI23674.1 mevalonate kinase [Lentilactobacillus hilgardii DSM 20176 = ATCC 8290]QEU38569.1 mevalonate kinase [Lentilactobacillus hilgardii]TDG80834.1 hypothetical protein C5L34_001542 [Lentilactobacillus hilgardii]
MKENAKAKSYAKIIWFGEHSVVYGKPAIALPLYNVDVHTSIKTNVTGQTINCRYFDGPISEMADNLKGVSVLIHELLTIFNATDLNFHLEIDSKIPSERGMGSSAATAVAIVRVFFNLFEAPLTRDRLLELAEVEEKITHGNPSGLDTATASSDTPVWFIRNEINEQIDFNLSKSSLVIADSGIKGKTGEAVSMVHDNLLDQPEFAKPLIEQLAQIAKDARHALQISDEQRLGRLMTQSQYNLSKLGVSTRKLDNFCRIAIQNGALGAKLTGSGLGGCMISIVENQVDAQRVATELLKAGATQTWIQSFTNYEFSIGDNNGNLVK